MQLKNLRKKCVNHDNSKFAIKQRKGLNLTTKYTFCVKVAQHQIQESAIPMPDKNSFFYGVMFFVTSLKQT